MPVITKLLSTHSGRDKFLRIVSYTSLYASATLKDEELGKKLKTVASQMSLCRSTLRLFDDIPMLRYSLAYGLGKHEPDVVLRVINVVMNAVDQLYYPVDHLLWAADRNIITLKNQEKWDLVGNVCYCVSLYLTVIRATRKLIIIQNQLISGKVDPELLPSVQYDQHTNIMSALQCMLDLGHAVHWLPKGILWGGKVEPWQRGFLGTLSSIISMYLAVRAVKKV